MIKNKSIYVTTYEAADILGITADYVRRLLMYGKIKGEKVGTVWLINKNELKRIRRQRFSRKNGE